MNTQQKLPDQFTNIAPRFLSLYLGVNIRLGCSILIIFIIWHLAYQVITPFPDNNIVWG